MSLSDNKIHERFLRNIKENLGLLKEMLEEIRGHWVYEDMIYRFYHQSFKVYRIQTTTKRMLAVLQKIAPAGFKLHPFLVQILSEGASEKEFEHDHNDEWLRHTRPMIEAFLHLKYFLEMTIKYGEELESVPQVLPSGWAGLLYLFSLR